MLSKFEIFVGRNLWITIPISINNFYWSFHATFTNVIDVCIDHFCLNFPSIIFIEILIYWLNWLDTVLNNNIDPRNHELWNMFP